MIINDMLILVEKHDAIPHAAGGVRKSYSIAGRPCSCTLVLLYQHLMFLCPVRPPTSPVVVLEPLMGFVNMETKSSIYLPGAVKMRRGRGSLNRGGAGEQEKQDGPYNGPQDALQPHCATLGHDSEA